VPSSIGRMSLSWGLALGSLNSRAARGLASVLAESAVEPAEAACGDGGGEEVAEEEVDAAEDLAAFLTAAAEALGVFTQTSNEDDAGRVGAFFSAQTHLSVEESRTKTVQCAGDFPSFAKKSRRAKGVM